MRHHLNHHKSLIISAIYFIAMSAVTFAQEEAAASSSQPAPEGLGLLVLLLGLGGVSAVGFFINTRDSVRESENNDS